MSSALSGFSDAFESGNKCSSHGKPGDFSMFHLYSRPVLCDFLFCARLKRWRSVSGNSVLAFIDPKSILVCLWLCLVLGIGAHTTRVVLKCALVTVLMCVLLYVVVSVRVLDWLTSDSLCASVSLHWVPVSSLYSFEYSHQSLRPSVFLSFTLLPCLLTSSVNVCVCV